MHVALQERGGAHLRAGHIADLAELDALLLLDQQRHGLGRRAAGVDGEGLAVQGLPVRIRRRIDDREEARRLQLADEPDRGTGLLDYRVWRAEGDVGLPAQDRFGGEVLLGELRELDVDPALADPLQRDQQVERLDPFDVAERDPDRPLHRGRLLGSARASGSVACGLSRAASSEGE